MRERGELPVGHHWMVPPGTAKEAEPAEPQAETDGPPATLTAEERRAEVQRLRAEGWSIRRIAETSGVGRSTVDRDARATISPPVAGGGAQRAPLTVCA